MGEVEFLNSWGNLEVLNFALQLAAVLEVDVRHGGGVLDAACVARDPRAPFQSKLEKMVPERLA